MRPDVPCIVACESRFIDNILGCLMLQDYTRFILLVDLSPQQIKWEVCHLNQRFQKRNTGVSSAALFNPLDLPANDFSLIGIKNPFGSLSFTISSFFHSLRGSFFFFYWQRTKTRSHQHIHTHALLGVQESWAATQSATAWPMSQAGYELFSVCVACCCHVVACVLLSPPPSFLHTCTLAHTSAPSWTRPAAKTAALGHSIHSDCWGEEWEAVGQHVCPEDESRAEKWHFRHKQPAALLSTERCI